jgi:subfamily B ATP-binding cassette protein MsbA
MSNPLPSSFQLYKRLFRSVKPYLWFFAVGIVCTALASGVDAGLAWMIKPIINQGLIARDAAFIRILPIAIVGIFILRGLLVFLSSYCIQNVGRSVVKDLRQQIFSHLLRLPASFYDASSSGQLLSRLIYNVEQVAEATTSALLLIVQESVLAIGLIIVMFLLSWKLTLFFMVIFPGMVFLSRYTSRRIRRLSTNVQKSVAEVSHIAEESIEGYRVIRTFGGEKYESDKFTDATENNRQREMKIVTTNSLGTAAIQVIISISIAATLMVATHPSMAVSAGSFAALITAMFTLLRPIRRINQTNNLIQKGLAGAHSIFELLDIVPEKDTGTLALKRSQGSIDYKQVSFTYPQTEKLILNRINFHIEPGETIALVGRSGGGKSTLVSMLPRFYDVTCGEILIDGVNIRDYQLTDLRDQFALVSQQVTLFNDTIARNISYGRLNQFDEAAIMKAAEAAHAMEFIRELPEQLNTLIGENGVLLSGGQRQRIAIARALLKDAPILILDEATSALDTESERHIQAALETLMQDRTTLVIAHRLSTIENADRILVIDHGHIIETGTHNELLQKNGQYAKLYAMQFKEPTTATHESV